MTVLALAVVYCWLFCAGCTYIYIYYVDIYIYIRFSFNIFVFLYVLGPTVPTAIGSWRLRSGSAHCDLALAVEALVKKTRRGALIKSKALTRQVRKN